MEKFNEFDIEVSNKLLGLRNSAKSRGIEFDLSFAKVKRLLSAKVCYFSGVKLTRIEGDDNQLSIDRVDNTRGYVDDNVVACARRLNRRKGDLTIDEIIMLYKKCVKHRK